MPNLPEYTPQQLEENREKAIAARRARAEVKQKIKARTVSAKEVLSSEDPHIQRMKVYDFVKAFPRMGDVRAKQMIHDLKIPENRRLSGLGERQKAQLVEIFDEDCD